MLGAEALNRLWAGGSEDGVRWNKSIDLDMGFSFENKILNSVLWAFCMNLTLETGCIFSLNQD